MISFLDKKLTYRRLHGGGKNQLIAKAVGIKGAGRPSVFDVTAGLGRDAFVLACLGCDVTMFERVPQVHAALQQALVEVATEAWFQALSLKLVYADSIVYLAALSQTAYPDVIYLDPMFPERHKTALVKKELRDLREQVGDDKDAQDLFLAALAVAKKRVVVKRARHALWISDRQPDVVYKGESSRFDVYQCREQ